MNNKKLINPYPYPSDYILETSTNCNLKCVCCFRRCKDLSHEDMPIKTACKIVDKLPWSRIFRIGVQGEPLLNSKNIDIMKYMGDMHKVVTITTNGTLLTDSKLVKSLPSSVKAMYISVDAGSPEVYKEYRQWDFDKWKEGVINLRKLRPEIQIQINYLLFKNNLLDVRNMLDFCKEIRASLSSTFPVIFTEDIGKEHDAYWLSNLAQIIEGNKRYANFIGVPYLCSTGNLEWRCCTLPWEQPLIGVQGDVYTDFFIYQPRNYDSSKPIIWNEWLKDQYKEVPQHEYRMSNIIEEEWSTIWNERYTPFLLNLEKLNNLQINNKDFTKMYNNYPQKYTERKGCGNWDYCKICVPKGTKILGIEPKNIEEFTINDEVLSKDGKEQKIIKTFCREYNGKVNTIKASYVLPVTLTQEHPVYASKITYVGAKSNHKYKYESPEFIDASDITNKYALVFPKFKENKEWNQPYTLSNELCEFLGLYIAKGFVTTTKRKIDSKIIGNHGIISLTFGKHETELVDKTKKLIQICFNKIANIKEGNTALVVQFHSVEIAKWLENFGKGAINKQIPSFMMYINNKDMIKSLLNGIIAGDGYKTNNRIEITTSSKGLALQLQKLFSKIDILTSIHMKRFGGKSVILGRNVTINPCYNVEISRSFIHKFNNTNKKFIKMYYGEDKDNFYLPVKSNTIENYKGTVYNFETEDNTYEVNNIVVHNCGRRWGYSY